MNYIPSQSVQKSYLKERVDVEDIRLFRDKMMEMLNSLDEEEHEEHNKNFVIKFLGESLYRSGAYKVNTYRNTDLAIYKDGQPAVLFEFKGPGRPDMVTKECLSRKSMFELVFYYIEEEVKNKNTEMTHLIITDCVHYFVFEKYLFYRLFARDKKFVQSLTEATTGKKINNDYIYNEIIKPKVESVINRLDYTYIDLSDFSKELRKDDILRTRKFIAAYKFFSPVHLLRLPYSSDHNTLDNKFYRELLYIMGVEEVVKDGVHKIERIKSGRQEFSLLEQAYAKLEGHPKIKDDDERFDIALGLVLIWINRILFLKLLESQLEVFDKSDNVRFLDTQHLPGYDELHDLFIEVLGKPIERRSEDFIRKFPSVPYLNSSLFEMSQLEWDYFAIGQLRLGKVQVFSATAITDEATGRKLTGQLPLLEYLFRFLSAYDFGAEKIDDVLRAQSKTIINASVLGLIFEKINGYKDGSFFTPGFITEYICSQTLRRAVVDKFNAVKGWACADFDELKDLVDYKTREDRTEANEIINSLRICDPAVGSGHFLVSALNEIIAIKSELQILQDHSDKPKRIQEWDIRVENDELIVFDEDGDVFQYDPTSPTSQRIQETLFEEKRTIIENCLFGVDLNPKSVDICRLRLWIELLKNAYYYRTADGKRQLQTLPNIDINIKHGNSLASNLPVCVGKSLGKSEIIKKSIKSYKENVRLYKNTHDKAVRNNLRNNIKSIKEGLNSRQLELFSDNSQTVEDNETMSKALEWMIEFPEVISDDSVFLGFDAIIGNPPYISLEKLRKDARVYARMKRLDESNNREKTYNTLESRGDIYTLFVERGLHLLKPGGLLSYIMPNKWTKVMYGRPLRSLFLQKNLTDIVDFGDNQIFDDATTYTCIIQMSNAPSCGNINVSQIQEVHPKTLADDVNEVREKFPVAEMNDGIWVISSLRNFHRVKALQDVMNTLDDYVDGECYYGIKTSLTKAFKITLNEYDDFVSFDETSASLLRPFLQGAGLKAFGEAKAGSYLLFLPKGFTAQGMGIDRENQPLPEEKDAWQWFADKYPAAASRLLPFEKDAKKRTDKGDYWWELRACAYYDKFAEPKLFYQRFQTKPCFLYDNSSAFFNDSMYFLSVPDKSLLALLCSDIGWWLISEFCPRIQNGHQLIWDNFKQIPIPETLPSELNAIAEELIMAQASNDTEVFEARMAELNEMVNELYKERK